MGPSRRRRALRAVSAAGALAVGLLLVVLWAGAANADEPTTGSITIVHNTIYTEAQDFEFLGCSGSGCAPFVLDDDTGTEDGGEHPDQVVGSDLAPGTYTISQPVAVPNWTLTSISCDTGETVDLPNRSVSIALTAGEDVRCVFTTQTQEITIRQDTVPDGPEDFAYTGCQGAGCSTFSLDDDTDPTLSRFAGASGLAPGTYEITQTAGPPLALTSITCNGSESISLGGRRVTITLAAYEHQTCTFTNRAPSITIVQDAAPNAAQDFSFTGCQGVGCSTFDLDDDADPTLASSVTGRNIAPGTYVITQAPSADWPLTALSCTTGESTSLANRQVTITLGATEQTTCTFTNTSATLTLVENTDPDSPQDFAFQRCNGSDCSDLVLDDDFDDTLPGTTGKVTLPAGTYVVTADEVDGYELAALSCATGEAVDLDARQVTVTLAASEQQTCTFTHRPPPPPLTGVAQITAGTNGSCARLTNGQARCWGNNDVGQIGDGTFTATSVPVEVLSTGGTGPLTDVADISAGFSNVCAALTSGEARCWGFGGQSLLGNGTTTGTALPVVVSNSAGTGPLTGVVDIEVGGNVACALLTTQQVACWGPNTAGQVGDGTTTTRLRPVSVSNSDGTGPLTDVVDLTVGNTRACAVLMSGEARCWGANQDGGLGDGTTTSRSRPVAVTNTDGTGPLTGVSQIVTGFTHTCARLQSGEARCWGSNTSGQMGNGTTTSATRPAVVSNPAGTGPVTDVAELSLYASHTCARMESASVHCWGENGAGALGDGTTADRVRPTPVTDVAGAGTLGDVAQVSAGISHSCARLNDGEARCWGASSHGGLGDGTTTGRLRPVVVIDPLAALEPITDVAEISAGAVHTCARLHGGGASCWGGNSSGQLGTADVNSSSVPVAVSNAAGDGPLAGVTQLSAGRVHTCAALSGGTAACWGNNTSRRLGDGTTTDRRRPVTVSNPEGTGPLTGVTQVSAGYDRTCAVLADTTARCWGAGTAGLFPVAVTDETDSGPLTGVTQIGVGEVRSCAVLVTGQVRCWGDPEAAPTVVANPEGTGPLTGATHVALGYSHACTLLSTGQVACWTGTGAAGPNLPQLVRNQADTGPLTGVSSLEADAGRTCVGLLDGTAACWGDGPLGDGTYTYRPLPTPVVGVTDVSGVTMGPNHTCLALADGQARCWGFNTDGRLGNGSVVTSGASFPGALRPSVVRVPVTP